MILKHCWHSTGRSQSIGINGHVDEYRCCFCGEIAMAQRVVREARVPKHGPYHTALVEESPRFSAAECPDRRRRRELRRTLSERRNDSEGEG